MIFCQSGRFGAGGANYTNVKTLTRPTAARYHRGIVKRTGSNGAYISEIEFRDSAGGSDLTTPSDTVVSNFSYNAPANLFDNNSGTDSFGAAGEYFGIDFGSGQSEIVEEVAITNQGSTQVFNAGRMEASADGSTWTVAWPLHKTSISGGTATNVFRYDEYANGLIFDLRATANPPVEQVSGTTATAVGTPTINTTTQYMTFASGILSLSVGDTYRYSGFADWTIEFHVDDCTTFNAPFGCAGAALEVYSSDGKLSLYGGGGIIATTTNAVLNGGAHHIAIVMKNNVPKVYVDGVSVALTTSSTGEWFLNSITFYVGGEGPSYRIFPGKLGRLLMWNFARYTGGFTPPSVTDIPLYEL